MLAPFLIKDSKRRKSIDATERMSVFLKYLVTSDSQFGLDMSYRKNPTTIRETCVEIWKVLSKVGISNFCKSIEKIAKDLEKLGVTAGTINGKHIVVQTPDQSGSFYLNYNKNHFIVSMAVSNEDMVLLYYIGIVI